MIWIYCTVLGLCLGLSSCKDDVTFASENKTTIDTMFLTRQAAMKAEMDSLCFENNVDYYDMVFDSVMEARIQEIETRLKAIESQNVNR